MGAHYERSGAHRSTPASSERGGRARRIAAIDEPDLNAPTDRAGSEHAAAATTATTTPTGSGATGATGGSGATAVAPRPLSVTPSSLFRAIVVIGVVTLVAVIGARAAEPVMWFVEAAVVAGLAGPLVHRLARHMPTWVAVLALTGAALAVVAALGAAAFGELHGEAERFRDNVPSAVRQLQEDQPFGGLMADLKVSQQIDRLADDLSERFDIGKDLPGVATALGGRVSTGFIIWILSVMLVFAGPGMVRATVRVLPERTASRVGPALDAAYRDSLRYLGLTTVRAGAVGVGGFVAASVLGIDMPVLLGTLAAIAAVTPYVGVLFAALPLALMAALNGPAESVAIVVVAVAAQTVDSVVVQPRIHSRSFTFGLFPTLVVTIVGFGLYGVTGLFLGLVAGTLVLALLQRLDEDGPGAGGPWTSGTGADAGAVLRAGSDEEPAPAGS